MIELKLPIDKIIEISKHYAAQYNKLFAFVNITRVIFVHVGNYVSIDYFKGDEKRTRNVYVMKDMDWKGFKKMLDHAFDRISYESLSAKIKTMNDAIFKRLVPENE